MVFIKLFEYYYILIIIYCKTIHPMICIFVNLGETLLTGWGRMRMRPARLVSYAVLYILAFNGLPI